MSITLQQVNSGDTDYRNKINENTATVEAAINALLSAAQVSGALANLSFANWMTAKFGGVVTIIGRLGYVPTTDGTDLDVAAGVAYVPSAPGVVVSLGTTLAFSGQTADTYYLHVNAVGAVTFDDDIDNALYSVVWTGSAFGTITRVANAAFDASEEDGSRRSDQQLTAFLSLDSRLESIEALAMEANELAYEASGGSPTTKLRTIGLTLDGGGAVITTGAKGMIQVPFAGILIGWSMIASAVGSIEIEVSKVGSFAPPVAPNIPNVVTNKITASAAPALTNDQSGAGGVAAVSTWSKTVTAYDVVQFNVVSVTALTFVTLYILMQETT